MRWRYNIASINYVSDLKNSYVCGAPEYLCVMCGIPEENVLFTACLELETVSLTESTMSCLTVIVQ
jgi:hypothetical protein